MPVMEGTRDLKTWRGHYSFAVDGGAIGPITLRSDDGDMPLSSVVLAGYVEVTTPVTSGGAATLAVQVEAANDIVNAAAVSGAPWSTNGRKSIIPVFTGATSVKTTAVRDPAIVVAAFALTAGVFDLVLFYL